MNDALEEALAATPETKRLYETSPVFKKAIDELCSCFDAARLELSEEDYGAFLKWVLGEEWT